MYVLNTCDTFKRPEREIFFCQIGRKIYQKIKNLIGRSKNPNMEIYKIKWEISLNCDR